MTFFPTQLKSLDLGINTREIVLEWMEQHMEVKCGLRTVSLNLAAREAAKLGEYPK